MFTILETQNLLSGSGRITLVPPSNGLLTSLLAAGESKREPAEPHSIPARPGG